jgi:hypothetical protein
MPTARLPGRPNWEGSSTIGLPGVGVDAGGNVVVTGWSRSANFPLLNSPQGLSGGMLINDEATDAYDAFVAKLTPDGMQLAFSRFIGGTGDDGANALALDSAGNIYITGPSTPGFTGVANNTSYGMFVAKLTAAGKLAYVFIRSPGNPNGIAVDSGGSAYVTGRLVKASALTKTFGPCGAQKRGTATSRGRGGFSDLRSLTFMSFLEDLLKAFRHLIRTAGCVVLDYLRLFASACRSRSAVEAENLFCVSNWPCFRSARPKPDGPMIPRAGL